MCCGQADGSSKVSSTEAKQCTAVRHSKLHNNMTKLRDQDRFSCTVSSNNCFVNGVCGFEENTYDFSSLLEKACLVAIGENILSIRTLTNTEPLDLWSLLNHCVYSAEYLS